MESIARLRELLPAEAGEALAARAEDVRELRLRAGRPVQLRCASGEWLSRAPLKADELDRILDALMDYSRYAREAELREGFFTLSDGCRVGVCGRLVWDGERVTGMAEAGSLCLRFARAVPGCADVVWPRLLDRDGLPFSTLILSPPGLGKTTLLRELARRLSEEGRNVCIADERHELAACHRGVPTLDVGPRTDVMDGCPKAAAIPRMLRAAAPEVIIADEIGGAADAAALAEAVRCGVRVIASAHAGGFRQLYRREGLAGLDGVFELGALLGGAPGHIAEIRKIGEEWHAFRTGNLRGGGVRAVRKRPVRLRPAQGGDAGGADRGNKGAADADAQAAGAGGGSTVRLGV